MLLLMNILLLDDNVPLADSLGEYLEGVGCKVDYAYTAKSCVNLVSINIYDVLILDITMPGMTGLDACCEIREKLQIATPLLFLTARDTLEDKLLGFSTGCDDYLVKPFAPEELWCRLNALNVRGPRRDIGIQKVGCLHINHSKHTVTRDNVCITLHETQFNILKLLSQHSPNIVSREKLEAELWGENLPESDALRTHMYRLRILLDKPFNKPLITTVHGKGYRLETD